MKRGWMVDFKSNLSLHSLYYGEACNEFAMPTSASLHPGNTAPFEEMSQRWRTVGNTASNLTGPRFEPQTSRSRDERVTARPTERGELLDRWFFNGQLVGLRWISKYFYSPSEVNQNFNT